MPIQAVLGLVAVDVAVMGALDTPALLALVALGFLEHVGIAGGDYADATTAGLVTVVARRAWPILGRV
jgi:hypothetical protein